MGRDRSLPRRSAVCGAQFRAVVGGLGAAVPSRQVMTAMLDDSKLKFTPLAGYALAATSIALATLAGKVLDPVQADPFPFVPFLAAVLIAALAMAGFAIHSLAVPRSAKVLCGGQRCARNHGKTRLSSGSRRSSTARARQSSARPWTGRSRTGMRARNASTAMPRPKRSVGRSRCSCRPVARTSLSGSWRSCATASPSSTMKPYGGARMAN